MVSRNHLLAYFANIVNFAFVNGSSSPIIFGSKPSIDDSYLSVHAAVKYCKLGQRSQSFNLFCNIVVNSPSVVSHIDKTKISLIGNSNKLLVNFDHFQSNSFAGLRSNRSFDFTIIKHNAFVFCIDKFRVVKHSHSIDSVIFFQTQRLLEEESGVAIRVLLVFYIPYFEGVSAQANDVVAFPSPIEPHQFKYQARLQPRGHFLRAQVIYVEENDISLERAY